MKDETLATETDPRAQELMARIHTIVVDLASEATSAAGRDAICSGLMAGIANVIWNDERDASLVILKIASMAEFYAKQFEEQETKQ